MSSKRPPSETYLWELIIMVNENATLHKKVDIKEIIKLPALSDHGIAQNLS